MGNETHADPNETARGVVYIARVPPAMTPAEMKRLLGRFAPVDRIYLAPSAGSTRTKARFTEGWIEFLDRRQARRTADLLNGQPMGDRKGVRKTYSQDLWCLRFLPGFQWVHLSERSAYERTVRDQRLHGEIAQAKRENSLYISQVERGKQASKAAATPTTTGGSFEQLKQRFRQRKVISD